MRRQVGMLLGVGLTLCMITGAVLAYEVRYWQRIYPGVLVAGENVGGMTWGEAKIAVNKLASEMEFLSLRWDGNKWEVSLSDLGVEYDIAQTVNQAMRWGRSGKVWSDMANKIKVASQPLNLEMNYSANDNQLVLAVSKIASQINIPAKEPEIMTQHGGKVIVTAGENGQEVDERELAARIRARIKKTQNEPVNIPVKQILPKLTEAGMERVRRRAESLRDKSLKIEFPLERQSWEVKEELIFIWLDPHSNGWKRGEIEAWVTELAHAVDRPPLNASVRVGSAGKVEEFRPEKAGYQVKVGEVTSRVISGLEKLEASPDLTVAIELAVFKIDPEIKTGDINNLGIRELLGKGESWYAGSITNRIFNLKRAAEMINGTLVASGEVFSFNQAVGEISATTGYKQAYIIKEGKTILGDGGGVCQTSSTLFRAVLAAGLPVIERTAHAYRVSYYEQNYQPGFDATVFQPAPDFKFKNDTPAHVLIQAEYDEKNKYLAFMIYGTNDNRVSEISKSRIWDITPPPPDLYIEDPNLPEGKVVQTEHRAYGAKVAFDWKVTRGDEVLVNRTFYSNYHPWQAVYLKGTKPTRYP